MIKHTDKHNWNIIQGNDIILRDPCRSIVVLVPSPDYHSVHLCNEITG